MKEVRIFEDIDTMIQLVNKYSKLNWEIENDDERYYIHCEQKEYVFASEYAAWSFLVGYALAIYNGKEFLKNQK